MTKLKSLLFHQTEKREIKIIGRSASDISSFFSCEFSLLDCSATGDLTNMEQMRNPSKNQAQREIRKQKEEECKGREGGRGRGRGEKLKHMIMDQSW